MLSFSTKISSQPTSLRSHRASAVHAEANLQSHPLLTADSFEKSNRVLSPVASGFVRSGCKETLALTRGLSTLTSQLKLQSPTQRPSVAIEMIKRATHLFQLGLRKDDDALKGSAIYHMAQAFKALFTDKQQAERAIEELYGNFAKNPDGNPLITAVEEQLVQLI